MKEFSMITTHPSVAEIDATINFLSVLEMAKDAAKLKGALASLKDAQTALAQQEKESTEAAKRAEAAQKRSETAANKVASEQAKLEREREALAKSTQDIEDSYAAMKAQRNDFDRWMAEERDKLSRQQALVTSEQVMLERAKDQLAQREAELSKEREAVQIELAAASEKRIELEAKLAGLKAMVA
jgi:chromosome segregation ATPase